MFETLNRGRAEGGVIFGDSEVIRLGDLPAIPVEQFVSYSSETILEIIESKDVDLKDKQRFIALVSFACGRLFQVSISKNTKTENNPSKEVFTKIILDMAPGIAADFGRVGMEYSHNPFDFEDGKVIISNFYELNPEDFVYFVSHIFGGGFFGWNPKLFPSFEKIKPQILELQDRLEGKPS